ncbi:MAG: 7,8-dihydro-8-oxoguanine-triphosphatase [Rhodobacterales bacterium]|nr:MAG: 7,8-dihydro-8-oxoguanine-triphosphatase [Rhodobacterales bacterium]
MTTAFHPLDPLPGTIRWRGACVLVRDAQGRALMQLRDDIPGIAAPGQWSLFGGGVEPGEDLLDGALREFHEETGIALAPSDLTPLCCFPSQARPDGAIYVFRCARLLVPGDMRLSEGAGFAFLTARQLEHFNLIPNFQRMFTSFLS